MHNRMFAGVTLLVTLSTSATAFGGLREEWQHIPTSEKGLLYAASFPADDDGWAVGLHLRTGENGVVEEGLALHWTGHAWTRVPIPEKVRRIDGISALSPIDVWAASSSTGMGRAGREANFRRSTASISV